MFRTQQGRKLRACHCEVCCGYHGCSLQAVENFIMNYALTWLTLFFQDSHEFAKSGARCMGAKVRLKFLGKMANRLTLSEPANGLE